MKTGRSPLSGGSPVTCTQCLASRILVCKYVFRMNRLRCLRSLLVALLLMLTFVFFTSLSMYQYPTVPDNFLHKTSDVRWQEKMPPVANTTDVSGGSSVVSKLLSFLRRNVLRRVDPPEHRRWRLLCWVLTSPKNLESRTQLIQRTWGARCDTTLYMSSEANASFPTIGLGTGEGTKQYNAEKALKAWTYIYEHHRDDADFFYKADDDTYAIVENLRHFLDEKDPAAPEFYGHRFLLKSKKVEYMSGGPGFVVTRRALNMLIRAFKENPECIPPGPGEDWKTGKCLTSVGAKAVDTRDAQGRERFMVFQVKSHLLGHYPAWYEKYDIDGQVKGHLCCSYYPISFHYVRDNDILVLEWFFYHARVFGVFNSARAENSTSDFMRLDRLVHKPDKPPQPLPNQILANGPGLKQINTTKDSSDSKLPAALNKSKVEVEKLDKSKI